MERAIPAFTSQPQTVTALWPVFVSHSAEHSRLEFSWLHNETDLAYPRTVIHLSIQMQIQNDIITRRCGLDV